MEKKKYYNKKIREQRIKIIHAIIEEEIENFSKDILFEQDYGYTSDVPQSGSGVQRTRNVLGMLSGWKYLKPILLRGQQGAYNFLTQAASLVGTIVGGVARFLNPFEKADRQKMRYLVQKMQYWEQESIKKISERFKENTRHLEDSWNTFRNDFYTIGLVFNPLGVIGAMYLGSAASEIAKPVLEGSAVILDNLSNGALERRLNGALEWLGSKDIRDPGTWSEYKSRLDRESDRRRYEREREEHTSRLENEWKDFNRARKSSGKSEITLDSYRNWISFNRGRSTPVSYDSFISHLVGSGRIHENIEQIIREEIFEFLNPSARASAQTNAFDELARQLSNPTSNTSMPSEGIGETIAKLQAIIGPEETNKVLKTANEQVLRSGEASANEQEIINTGVLQYINDVFGPRYVNELNQLISQDPSDVSMEKINQLRNPSYIEQVIRENIQKQMENVDISKANNAIKEGARRVAQDMQRLVAPNQNIRN